MTASEKNAEKARRCLRLEEKPGESAGAGSERRHTAEGSAPNQSFPAGNRRPEVSAAAAPRGDAVFPYLWYLRANEKELPRQQQFQSPECMRFIGTKD